MKKKIKISQSFQRWLIVLVAIAFLATTAFLWLIQTHLSEENAFNLLKINLSDVYEDIIDASNENLLKLTRNVAQELNACGNINNMVLQELMSKYDVTEINIIDENGFITATTYSDFLNYDMRLGAQSAEFMVLLEGEDEFVQSYQPVSYRETEMYSRPNSKLNRQIEFDGEKEKSVFSRKYGGVTLKNGGFVQVGYDAERFQKDIDEFVIGVTRNRHVGESGCIIVADENWNIVSDRFGNEGKNLDITGIWIDTDSMPEKSMFIQDVYGKSSLCMYQHAEGYYIVAVMPGSEAALSRNVSVSVTTAMQIVVFAALFVMVYILVRRLVVKNIYEINESLSKISDGNLDTVVNVRSHVEFDDLSNDINSTVDTLKRYIADAAARIDAELAFAQAIQHSAIPSVFPPYPDRKEFDIHAKMFTAREVGGDFYDFYFIDENHLAFLVADVSGKGIPAAMFMMQSKTLLKSLAESKMSVEQVMTSANEKLCEGNDAGMFVTVWMGILDVKTGVLTFANAGHNPPILKKADGTTEFVKTRPGLVLAGMEGVRYRKNEICLEKGDILYLYTDGVTEAANKNLELYGENRLISRFGAIRENCAEAVCEFIKNDVDAFSEDAEQFDDITMLCLCYRGPSDETEGRD